MATNTTVTASTEPAVAVDEEARLIRQAQSGDREAFGELYLRHRPAVARYLRWGLGPTTEGTRA
jgi:hypothetical protein